MKRHLSWAIPLLAALTICIGAGVGALELNRIASRDASISAAFGAVVLGAIALIGTFIGLFFAIAGAVEMRRKRRHSEGRFTSTERAPSDAERRASDAWRHSSELRLGLLQRRMPEQIRTWDLIANDGEVYFYDVSAEYSRFYGETVSYSRSSGFYSGRPAFVIAGLVVSAVGNAARHSAAVAQARAQWRENQPCRLIVSNQRLVCQVGGQWLSFYYSAMTATYPEVGTWTLVTQFDSAAPLMLRGLYVPAAALITILMTHGVDALAEHPDFRRFGGLPGDHAGRDLDLPSAG